MTALPRARRGWLAVVPVILALSSVPAACASSRPRVHTQVRAQPTAHRPATARRATATATPTGGRVLTESFYSPSLHRRRIYVVYLPAGYAAAAASGVRYPVFYLLHSAVGGPSGMVDTQHVERVLQAQVDAGRTQSMILVWPDGRIPGVGSDSEFANTRFGRYMDGVVDTVHAVDGRFSTIADRQGRLFGGISTGGYAAANICLHHLPLCGGFESWSGYFVQTRAFPFDREPLANLLGNSPVDYVDTLRSGLVRYPTWGFAYQGTHDHTASDMALFFQRFLAAGGHGGYAYYGGGHGWGLWRRQLPHMYGLASGHLAAPLAARAQLPGSA
jgi:enterochelin esterase-like enzyme